MGIGEWFGLGGRKEPETELTPAPTSTDLLTAVDRVEAMARDGRAPSMVLARLGKVARTIRQTIPRMDRLGAGNPQTYNVMATATDYLPEAIGGYLRLPRDWADSRPVDRGKTPLLILVDQLDLLGATMDKVYDAINRADAEALVVHGRFLQEKFGPAAAGGALRVSPDSPVPAMPEHPPAEGGDPGIRLTPPSGGPGG